MNLKVYQAGLKFMLVNAVKRLYNGEVIFHHSLDHGIYATIITEADKQLAYMSEQIKDEIVKNNK